MIINSDISEHFQHQYDEKKSIFCRINTGIFKQRYASIYLPLISFKSGSRDRDMCDVGTFSSIEKLIDFCNTCGIYQIILDIEKVNDYYTFDPIHYDTRYDTEKLITYDIDSIRNLKKAALQKEQDFKFINDAQYSAFKEDYSKCITNAKNENLVFAQYKCYSQLHKAYLHACEKNISIATIICNDNEIENKVYMASKYSHSIYICNPFQKPVNKDLLKKIDKCGLTIMVDSSIAEVIKFENLSFIFPCEYKDYLIESENKSFGTFMGPKSLKASLVSEFPSEKSQKDIKHAIEDRVYSDENVSIFYLTDLLYITLPGAERDIHQPLRGKITENQEYWRYLYNFTVDDLTNDSNVIAKTKELLINGNRYYKGEIDKQ